MPKIDFLTKKLVVFKIKKIKLVIIVKKSALKIRKNWKNDDLYIKFVKISDFKGRFLNNYQFNFLILKI
jgi:hypothetical protein